MIFVNKQLEKFKGEFGDYFINKMHEAYPHLYDKNDKKKQDFYAEFDESDMNLLVETTIENGKTLKEKLDCFIVERRKFIAEEQKRLTALDTKYKKQFKAMAVMLPDKQLKEFTKTDYCRSMYDDASEGVKDNAGRVCIIPLDKLKKKYRKPEYQLFRVLSGFDVSPSAVGNACYGYFCADGESCRWERYNFLGIGNGEVEKIAQVLEAEWADDAGARLEKERDELVM